jgi:UDP-N-acetylmuramoylalanine--D-glutamate ligase
MNICIYGYGLEGKSTEKFLKKHFDDLNLVIFDENIVNQDVFEPDKYDLIFVSPGINRFKKIPKKHLSKCTSQIEYFFMLLPEHKRKKVIGITGSKGKSTTTKFCKEFLEIANYRVSVAGNFGKPFLDILDDFLLEKYDFIVAEISSFQAEFLSKSPHISIFLSFFPEHIDRHGNETKYLSAKANCWRHQEDGDFLIFPESLNSLSDLQKLCSKKNRLILAPPLSAELFPQNSVFRAPHFLQNFGVISVLSNILKINNFDKILNNLTKNFIGLPHRSEFIGKKKGMLFYNDSIATGPEAAVNAVNFFGKNLGYLLLGGQSGGGNFDILLRSLVSKNFTGKVLITKSPILKLFENSAKNLGFKNYKIIKDFHEALDIVFKSPIKNRVCLLAPAGKSFDQYSSYTKRGDHFRKMIMAK